MGRDAQPTPFPRCRALGVLAALCLAVLVFSYLLTFAIAVVCLGLPVWIYSGGAAAGLGGFVLASMGLIIGGTILWSLIPRHNELTVKGVELDLSVQPRLKELIDRIAARIHQRTPDHVYLIPDANAFVTERGGTVGFGERRRVMGLGLPLMANMPAADFAAVLTHEFAHYYSGDTRLGPRVFQTRMAMARTIQNLAAGNSVMRLLSRFAVGAILYAVVVGGLVAYWKLFMRFTQLVSRQQEYRADELACCIVGPAAMAEGLRSVTAIGATAPSFWRSVINPVITAGYLPPLADGFARYYTAPAVRDNALRAVAETLKNPKTNAYDTHPALKLRLERIGKMNPASQSGAEQRPALELLDGLPALERRLLAMMAPKMKVESLKPIDWDSAARSVWLPIWRKHVKEHAKLLQGQTVGALPEVLRDLSQIGTQIPDPPGTLLTREQRLERAFNLAWMALGVRLEESGWEIQMQPGQFFFMKGEERFTPPDALAALRQGKTSTEEWQKWCERSGLGGVTLAET